MPEEARVPDHDHNHDHDPRKVLLDALLEKVAEDPYPSSTMLDVIEELLTPEDVGRYVEVLMRDIRESDFPSISLIRRVEALAG